jgi:hypothetical protein
LRYAEPLARLAFVYVIRADDEACRAGISGHSPIGELATFMRQAQEARGPMGKAFVDACALIAADQDQAGIVRLIDVGSELDIRAGFFERFLGNNLG